MPPNPSIEEAVTLHRQGRLDEAEKAYTRILKLKRDHFDALHLLGMLNHQRGRHAEAHRLISSALKANPRSPEALSNSAMVLHALKRDNEALIAVDRALALAPDHPDALNNRGNLLLEMKRYDDAAAAFRQVLAVDPRHAQARINHGNALAGLGRAEEALAEYELALSQIPGHPLACYNKANALRMLGRQADAIAAYDQAVAALPQHVNSWMNRGLALMSLNRHAEAIESHRRALAIQPDNADVHFNEALALLTIGDYERGFPKYEWRWKRSGAERPRFRKPPWLGESSVQGKSVLLHAEQGLGDTIQFVRYVSLLAGQGADVRIEVPPPLKQILSSVPGVKAAIAQGEAVPPFDLHCPMGSLPLACRTSFAAVPAAIPYLFADNERIERWRPRIEAQPGPRIALVWSGRAAHANDRNRSLALADLEPLLATAGVSFIGLQKEIRPADADRLAAEPRLLHLGEQLADFSDTAAVLSLCDLTVCVDTSVAHLAGALGRPLAVLLPFQADWRWTADRDRSPWYPQARLFRQRVSGDWTEVLERVRQMLGSGDPGAETA
jgi:tetratricopeptide (TPR) repeat protein